MLVVVVADAEPVPAWRRMEPYWIRLRVRFTRLQSIFNLERRNRASVQAAVAVAAAALFLARAPATVTPTPAEAPSVVVGVADLEQTVALLEAQLNSSELSPVQKALIDENLAVIDDALAEIRSALAARPGDRELQQTLARVYRRKVDLLHDATLVAGG